MPRTGRRPGAGGTRETILAAARAEFGEVGYEGATVRAIAAVAAVDPALVLHYFGSKESLFVEAIEFPIDPAQAIPKLLEPGLEGLGGRLVQFFFETWDSPTGTPMLGVLRSMISTERAASMMRDFITREVLGRLAEALDLDHPQLRATLAASQLIGMAVLRYVVKVEPVAAATPAQLAGWLGPTVQRYLTDPATTR